MQGIPPTAGTTTNLHRADHEREPPANGEGTYRHYGTGRNLGRREPRPTPGLTKLRQVDDAPSL